MTNKILGLRTVIYKVPDLTKAKEWYGKAFNREPYFDEPFYVGFRIGGYELGLLPVEDENNIVGNSVTTYWGTEELDRTMEHMFALGASQQDDPQDVGGGVVVASVKDPWGNVVGLIYNPHFKIEE